MPTGGPISVSGRDHPLHYPNDLPAQLAESEEVERADVFLQTALELAPNAARLDYNHGTFLVKQRRDGQAFAHLDHAIERGWDEADARVNRGVALSRLDRTDEARGSFERTLELDPSNKEARANLRKIGGTPR
jgi:Tfp pilus assembly protein PilF